MQHLKQTVSWLFLEKDDACLLKIYLSWAEESFTSQCFLSDVTLTEIYWLLPLHLPMICPTRKSWIHPKIVQTNIIESEKNKNNLTILKYKLVLRWHWGLLGIGHRVKTQLHDIRPRRRSQTASSLEHCYNIWQWHTFRFRRTWNSISRTNSGQLIHFCDLHLFLYSARYQSWNNNSNNNASIFTV